MTRNTLPVFRTPLTLLRRLLALAQMVVSSYAPSSPTLALTLRSDDTISVYETPSMQLLDKKSFKLPGVKDFQVRFRRGAR
jgi:hypothetical protein